MPVAVVHNNNSKSNSIIPKSWTSTVKQEEYLQEESENKLQPNTEREDGIVFSISWQPTINSLE
jgi:hypothetical protein